jgi:outer membrane usher protein FimD/PapC
LSRAVWPALAVLLGAEWSNAAAFDSETLRLRGIDPHVAASLGEKAQFSEGVHAVRLVVNGQPKGIVNARFDATGQPCIDKALRDASELQETDATCDALFQQFPQSRVEAVPQSGELRLLVPVQALRTVPADLSAYTRGGVAGLLNYDVQGLSNDYNGQRSHLLSANTELGVNAGDWVLRSRQLYSSVPGLATWQHQEAYAQRTFSEQRAQLQLGQITLSNPVLAGVRVTGAQWLSEPALGNVDSAALVQGIAATQARVDLHQDDVLVYSTVVPAGPFELHDIAQLDRRRDLRVTVIEADGQRRSFIVPSATLGLDLPARGFAFGIGQWRDSPSNAERPWVLSVGGSHPLGLNTRLSNAALLAQDYQAAGAGISLQPWPGARLQGLLQLAHANGPASSGGQTSLSLNQQLAPNWSMVLNAGRQTPGYREMLEIQSRRGEDGRSRPRAHYTAGLSWTHPWFGSLGGTYSTTTHFDGRQAGRAQLNWSKRLGKVALNATGQWQTTVDRALGNALYLSASIPLGERVNWRSSARQDASGTRLGSGVQGQWDPQSHYRLAVERGGRDGQTSYNAGASRLTRAAQVDLGYASYGHGNHGYSAGARGSVVAHDEGLTLSPYLLRDTFGLLSLDNVSGVQIDTPGGTVWTDGRGQAVLPQLTPFGRSNVQVATASLPRNVDVHQGTATILAARGAIPRVRFASVVTRRLLLEVLDDADRRLDKGTAVTDEQGVPITLAQEDGAVFVPNVHSRPRLFSRNVDGRICELHFVLPERADSQLYFERAAARCRVP